MTTVKKKFDNCRKIQPTTTVKNHSDDNCKKTNYLILRNYKDIAGLGFPAGILIVFTHEIIPYYRAYKGMPS